MNTPSTPPATPARLRAVRSLLALLLPVFVFSLLLAVPQTRAAVPTDVATLKLFGKWTDTTPDFFFLGSDPGGSDLSPKWIAIGAPLSSEREGVGAEGSVQVFNAVTGAWVRKILPPVGTGTNAYFGAALAISGDLVAVAARAAASTRGLVFVYNLKTGALVKTLSLPSGGAGDELGYKVAFVGNTVVTTAPQTNGGRGTGYIFNATTGALLGTIAANDAAINDKLGNGLAMEGNLVALGATNDDANWGSVYLFDISNPAAPVQVRKIQPGSVGDQVGRHLAMHQGKLVIGCNVAGRAFLHDVTTAVTSEITLGGTGASFGKPVAIHGPIIAVSEYLASGDQGAVHLFKTSDRSFIRTLTGPNGDTSQQHFGQDFALHGSSLLVTAPFDNTQPVWAGAAYLISPITEAMPFTRVAAKGDFVPGTPASPGVPAVTDISYNVIGDVSVNSFGEVLFSSSLTGDDSNKGKDVGVFSSVENINTQKLLFKTRSTFSGTTLFGVPSRLSMNDTNLAIGFSTLTGPGVNATNNQLLWYKTDAAQGTLIRTGPPFATTGLAGTVPTSIIEAVTGNLASQKQVVALCNLKVGVGGTTAVNDSTLYLRRVDFSEEALREGADAPAPLPATADLGQFAPRVANHYSHTVFSTALTGTGITTATNAAVFARTYGGAPNLVAQKGDVAVDGTGATLTGVTYSSFIGESSNGTSRAAYRATVAGAAPAVTAATNEGLWMLRSDGVRRLAFRKGQTLAVAGGAKIAKIVQYWYIGSSVGDSEVLALVQLSGSGVTAANDQALVLFQYNFTHNVLMREGDPAPGCSGARIGVISRVDADAWRAGCALIVTLTGATPTTDQALYTALFRAGAPTISDILVRPCLRLRKGQLFDNQPGKIKSFSLNNGGITPSGAGGTGRGRGISWNGHFAFVVEFENGIRQAVRGTIFP